MLTPVEIQAKTFKSGGLGYDKKDVESFMREVTRSYEILYRENMELKDKVAVLNEGIQYYKSIEKTLQKALVLAEKTAETTKEAANKDAKRIEKEAKVKANILLADAKNELENLHNKTIALLQQYEKYKAQFKNLAQAQIDLIETDAFNINIQKLDVFISEETDTKKNEKEYDETENDVHELVAEEGAPMYKDSFSEEGEEVEFDYTDFEDNDDSKGNDLNLSDLGDND